MIIFGDSKNLSFFNSYNGWSYNEEYLRNRRNDDLYPNNEMWHWSWDTEVNQKFFENKRIKSDQYNLIAKFGIGFLFLNT